MSRFLGIDTSNYTTSLAVVENGIVVENIKKLLIVEGRGIRQSDALFQHTKNLPELFKKLSYSGFDAVGVSERPRDAEGSYMPCFLAGVSAARAVSSSCSIPYVGTSHQNGHIMAALYSCSKTELMNERFIAFHVSGGTTEMLLCDRMNITKIGGTLDLNAGQLVDRIGVKMGLAFPAGKALEQLSAPLGSADCMSTVRGLDCHLSGLENKASAMLQSGVDKSLVSAFVLKSIMRTLDKLTENALKEYGKLPLVFSGGVMSNKLIASYLKDKYGANFAHPEFSCDNAAGVALIACAKNS